MADLSITAASVQRTSNTIVEDGTAGAAITAGQVCYKEASSGKYKLTDANSATAEVKTARGIALNGGSDGQPLSIATGGDISLGAILTAGTIYYASDTPGGIESAVATQDVILLGIAKTTSILSLRITNTGVTVA